MHHSLDKSRRSKRPNSILFSLGRLFMLRGVSSFLVYQRLKVFADEFKVTDGSIFRRVWVFTYIIGNRVDSWSLPYTWELFLFLEAVMQFRQYWWYLCDYVLLSRAMSFLQWGFWWVIRKFALHDWGESDKDSHSVLT